MTNLSIISSSSINLVITQVDSGVTIEALTFPAVTMELALPGSISGPQGVAGPAGPAGPQGPIGPVAPSYNVSFVGAGAGQSVSLPAAPSSMMLLIIQGLMESPAEYSVSGTTLVIPPGLVWDGAECQFVFS